MPEYTIRRAIPEETSLIMNLLDMGRERMQQDKNTTQWPVGTPSVEKVQEDIARGESYLLLAEDEAPVGTFALCAGDDPFYGKIDGAWLNDAPYYTIHRVAGNPQVRGLARAVFAFSAAHAKANGAENLRIDTHKDNRLMRRVIEKAGFTYCGIVWMADGTERLAFQKIL